MIKWLKKILPPPVNTFNRELQTLKEYINKQNQEIINLQNRSFIAISEIEAEKNALGLKQNELLKIVNDNQKRHSELQDEIRKITARLDALLKNQDEIKLAAERATSSRENTDIEKQLWALAGRQTAEYVSIHMNKCRMFKSPESLREYTVQAAGAGLYVEFGVFSGKSINQIAALKPNDSIYGFDSFEGLPETWRSGFETGKFSRETLPQVNENVVLIKGWFENTLPDFVNEHQEECAFIHIDCDLYSSTKTIFNLLGNRINEGTIILFDEYFNYPGWQDNEFRAFQEFVEKTGKKYEYIGFVKTYEQVAVRIL